MTIKRHEPEKILCNVVEGGGMVFTAGVTADDLSQDVKGQTQQILADIDRYLALCGSSKSKILSATIWVTDIRTRPDLNDVWTKWVDGKNLPARACVEAKLADPRCLVEIAVVAVK